MRAQAQRAPSQADARRDQGHGGGHGTMRSDLAGRESPLASMLTSCDHNEPTSPPQAHVALRGKQRSDQTGCVCETIAWRDRAADDARRWSREPDRGAWEGLSERLAIGRTIEPLAAVGGLDHVGLQKCPIRVRGGQMQRIISRYGRLDRRAGGLAGRESRIVRTRCTLERTRR